MNDERMSQPASAPTATKRRTLRRITTGALLSGLLAIGVVATAAQGGMHHGHGGPDGFGPNGDPAAMAEHLEFRADWILSKIGASDQQKTQIHAILQSAAADLAPLQKQHCELRKQMRDALVAPTIDRALLTQLRTQQMQLADKTSARMQEALIASAEVLTPEQRKAVAERFDKHGPRQAPQG